MNNRQNQKTTLLTSCTAHGIQDGLSVATAVLLPILAQTYGLNYGQVGLFKAAKSLAQSLLEIFSGHACEQFGKRNILVFGLVISGLGYLLLSFAGTPQITLISFIILGIGGAYHHAPSSALVSSAYSVDKRRRSLGLYNSSGDIGKLIFTGLISLAAMAAISWQNVAFSYGLITIGAAIAIYWGLKRAGIGADLPNANKDTDEKLEMALGWGILDRPKFTSLLATVFLDSIVQVGVLTFIAFAMIAKGVPIYTATLAPVLILIGGMFGKAACGFLADLIGIRTAFAILQGLTAIGLIFVVILDTTPAFTILPFLGLVLQGTTSITYVIVNDLIHPSRTVRGYSMIYGASSLAAVLGPFGFGRVGDLWGINTAILIMAVFALIAIVPCWTLKINQQMHTV
jgi:FSR family fosmidomycin resistance protein-like MFS transporter